MLRSNCIPKQTTANASLAPHLSIHSGIGCGCCSSKRALLEKKLNSGDGCPLNRLKILPVTIREMIGTWACLVSCSIGIQLRLLMCEGLALHVETPTLGKRELTGTIVIQGRVGRYGQWRAVISNGR